MSGINNPTNFETRAINLEKLKRCDWLTGPAWLKRAGREWLEQVNLTDASGEENMPSSVFIIHAKEGEYVFRYDSVTIFKLLKRDKFGEEMESLTTEKEHPKSSKILQLSPFLDEERLICDKGRVGKSHLDFNAKYQILIH